MSVIRSLIGFLLVVSSYVVSAEVLAEEVSPFNMTPMELITKGVEQEEGAYIASGALRCGSLLTLIDTMMELSFGEPVFDGSPGKKMSGIGYNISVALANKRGSKYTKEELMQSVLNEQSGYDKIYMTRMQNNKLRSGDFFKEDKLLMAETKECLEVAKVF